MVKTSSLFLVALLSTANAWGAPIVVNTTTGTFIKIQDTTAVDNFKADANGVPFDWGHAKTVGSYIEYTLSVSEAATYRLYIDYAATKASGANVIVNGTQNATFSFPTTGAMSTYKSTSTLVRLPAGTVTLEVEMSEAIAFNVSGMSLSIPLPSTTVIPEAAAEFVNSIGTNVHLGFEGSTYTTYFAQLETLAVELGIKHFRDGVELGDPNTCARMNSMANATGGDFIATVAAGQTAATIESFADGCLSAAYINGIEGPNEEDIASPTDYVNIDVAAMEQIDLAVSTYPDLQGKKVIAPSMGATPQDYVTIAESLSTSQFTTGNDHIYFSTFNPGTLGWGGMHPVGGKSYKYGSLAYNFAFSEALSGSDPMYVTETGYQSDKVGETLQANYISRALMLEHADAPAGSRQYIYEFADDGTVNGTKAIVDANGNPKPAYTMLKNLISALADPAGGTGEGVSLAPVAYALTGDTSNVDTMVYRKSSGEIDVVVWIETDEFNKGIPAPQNVSVQVNFALKNVTATDAPQVVVFAP